MLLLLSMCGGCVRESRSSTRQDLRLAAAEEAFLIAALKDSWADQQLGHLAQQRAVREGVRRLGGRMVEQDRQAGRELRILAESKGVAIPDAPDDEHRRALATLRQESGAHFDRAFLQAVQERQERRIGSFQAMAATARDPEIKAWASGMLPRLRSQAGQVNTLMSKPPA